MRELLSKFILFLSLITGMLSILVEMHAVSMLLYVHVMPPENVKRMLLFAEKQLQSSLKVSVVISITQSAIGQPRFENILTIVWVLKVS